MKKILQPARLGQAATITLQDSTAPHPVDTSSEFQNEFENEPANNKDSNAQAGQQPAATPPTSVVSKPSVLAKAGLFNYGLKFSADYVLAGITNNVIINRYQPYQGGAGPIQLNNGNDVDFSFRVGVSDVFEDLRFIGGIRFGTTLSDKDILLSVQNDRGMLD